MDHAAIAAMYTRDGEMAAEGAPTIRGPSAIKAHLEGFKDFHVLSETLTTDSINVEGNTARVVGTYHQRVRVPAGDTIVAFGQYTADWLRDAGGQWRVRRMATAPRQ
jgi:ketosteroid isomerase-like protein